MMIDVHSIRIKAARSCDDLAAAANLFTAYAKSLGFDLGFQDFSTEVNSLPGKYGPPKGDILLAHDSDDKIIGCVALRPLQFPGCCEMKRLYVTPVGRGSGIGEKLVDAILDLASHSGYREMRLDTLSSMQKAIQLYEKRGFKQIEPYYETPLADTIFLARDLPVAQDR